MKKLIFFLLLLLSTASLFAQSEQPSDSIRHCFYRQAIRRFPDRYGIVYSSSSQTAEI